MAGKTGFSFGFAKKAEPKRHVEALSVKKVDEREEIRGVEEGQLALEKPKEGQGPPVILCKNPLDARRDPSHVAKKTTPNSTDAEKPKLLDKPLEECGGGIVSNNMAKLSNEDAEAMRELLKDAAREGTGEDAPVVAAVPILMKAGIKKNRETAAPQATKEMFDNVSVESFGEAMLRGMGYDPKLHTAKPIIRDKLRDNLLGLGAKALLPGEKEKIKGKRKAAPPPSASSVAKPSAIAGAAPEEAVASEAAATSSTTAPQEGATATSSESSQKRPRVEVEDSSSKPATPVADVWASRGLVVKIVSREASLKEFFGAEAVVLEVDEAQQCCRIKARPQGSDKSQQLKGVQLKDIETRVSRECQKVRIVRGAKKGLVAKLVKRDTARGKALLNIEGAESEMSLDDVCQFME